VFTALGILGEEQKEHKLKLITYDNLAAYLSEGIFLIQMSVLEGLLFCFTLSFSYFLYNYKKLNFLKKVFTEDSNKIRLAIFSFQHYSVSEGNLVKLNRIEF